MKRNLVFAFLIVLTFTACEGETNSNVVSDDELHALMNYEEPALPVVDSNQILSGITDTVPEIENNFPMPNGWVNDYDLLFTTEEKDSLRLMIETHYKSSGNEIYLVTIGNVSPYDNLSDYTVALGNAWKTSQDSMINNVLIVLSVPYQEVRIECADALTGNFSAQKSEQIIFATMMPQFSTGNFYQGVYSGIEETIEYFENN